MLRCRTVRKASFADMNCSVARALEVIGEWWTLLILRDAFLGVTRFEEWTERLGIARNMLSTRLDTLVETGVMERKVYDEARDRADYVLTEKGRALWPVMVTIREWGNEWISAGTTNPSTCSTATAARSRSPRWCATSAASGCTSGRSATCRGPATPRTGRTDRRKAAKVVDVTTPTGLLLLM